MRKFESVLLTCNDPYPSGRIYPRELMSKAIEEYNKKYDQLYVEAPGNNTETVDMTQLVGVIEDLHIDGDKVKGTVVLLDTPEANKIKDLDLKVSLFGAGDIEINQDGSNTVASYTIVKAIVSL